MNEETEKEIRGCIDTLRNLIRLGSDAKAFQTVMIRLQALLLENGKTP